LNLTFNGQFRTRAPAATPCYFHAYSDFPVPFAGHNHSTLCWIPVLPTYGLQLLPAPIVHRPLQYTIPQSQLHSMRQTSSQQSLMAKEKCPARLCKILLAWEDLPFRRRYSVCSFLIVSWDHICSSCFVVAATSLTQNLIAAPASGLMGLAFSALSVTKSTPFWQSLSDGGQLTSTEFAFQLTRERGTSFVSDTGFGGTFTLGGTNSSLYSGNIEFLNMANSATPTYWLLNMAGERMSSTLMIFRTYTLWFESCDRSRKVCVYHHR
jgi:Eukaryotic aspartyl protease